MTTPENQNTNSSQNTNFPIENQNISTTTIPEETNSVQKIGDLQNVRLSYRFSGRNYLKWSQFVRTYLKGKGRLAHIIGLTPPLTDPTYKVWDEEDSMIMSWLWDFMDPIISDTCMFLTTAKEIWDFMSRTYSKAQDAAQIYEIKVKIAATKQGSKTVTEYATALQNMWQELDHYQVFMMKCTEDAAILKNLIAKDRVYEFLAGLNAEYDPVRIQILGKQDLPSLEEVISLIRAEESRSVMLESQVVESSVFNTRADPTEKEEVIGLHRGETTRIIYGAHIARNASILRTSAESYMGNQPGQTRMDRRELEVMLLKSRVHYKFLVLHPLSRNSVAMTLEG